MRPRFLPALLLPALTTPALVAPGAAEAHAILLDSQPPAHGVTAPGATGITLRFNSRIDAGRSRLTLRAGGQEQVLALAPSGAGDVLTAQADLRPGGCVLRWQVLAVDGHITRGEVPFSVEADPAGAGKVGAGGVDGGKVDASGGRPGLAPLARVRAP